MRFAANGLIVASVTAVLIGGWSAAQLRFALAAGAPLLIEPFSIAVSADGSIYCGVDADRIHVYAPDGEFLNAWTVASGGLPFRIQIGEGDVRVATQTGLVYHFRPSGEFEETREDAAAFERFGASNDYAIETAARQRYAIDAGIVRVSEGRRERVVAPAPAPLRFFQPFPVLLFPVLFLGVFGLIVGVITNSGGLATKG